MYTNGEKGKYGLKHYITNDDDFANIGYFYSFKPDNENFFLTFLKDNGIVIIDKLNFKKYGPYTSLKKLILKNIELQNYNRINVKRKDRTSFFDPLYSSQFKGLLKACYYNHNGGTIVSFHEKNKKFYYMINNNKLSIKDKLLTMDTCHYFPEHPLRSSFFYWATLDGKTIYHNRFKIK